MVSVSSAAPPERSCGAARWWWRSCRGGEEGLLRDAFLPPAQALTREPFFRRAERPVPYLSARWTPDSLTRLVSGFGDGAAALREIPSADLLAAWGDTVATFLRPGSLERRALDPALAKLCKLSKEGLKAGLEAVLGGVRREPAAALL